ncbi:MAG TPA: hypothetical protein VJ866_12205 [Pyrinomonadaceae bacterium]|nr:hypothetical protein [Pyrinomonadaceae bacterium]
MPNKIWHANDNNAADWFEDGVSALGLTWEKQPIPKPGTAEFLNLPEAFKNILRLDNPDIIATLEVDRIDRPVISVEITATTPQSQHAKQRVPRLVAAAEADVASIYIIPGRKLSGGSPYSLGADIYFGTSRIGDLNDIPVLVYRYPDVGGILQHSATYPNQPELSAPEIQNAFTAIRTIIKYKLAHPSKLRDFKNALDHDMWIKAQRDGQRTTGASVRVNVANYTTLTEIDTADLPIYLRTNTVMTPKRITDTFLKLPNRILSRERTLIMRASRLFSHAGDPYCGMLAFFDYAFCRVGREVEERDKNLVFMPYATGISRISDEFAPNGYHRFWADRCPFSFDDVPSVTAQFNISHHLQYGCVYTKIKPLRIYGYFSDMIIFQDAMLVF